MTLTVLEGSEQPKGTSCWISGTEYNRTSPAVSKLETHHLIKYT